MARSRVVVTIYNPVIDFQLKAPGGWVSKDITKRTFRVYRWARTLAPVRTGRLKSRIFYEVRHGTLGPRGRVTSPVKYTMPVHEGSSAHWIRPKARKRGQRSALQFTIGGETLYRRAVYHPGTYSNPFLTKALLRAADD